MNPGAKTETAVSGVLMAAFMAASPFVAYAAGRWAEARLSRAAEAQRSALRRVPATLLQLAPVRHPDGATPARWRLPDGQVRTGSVSAPRGATAGSTVMVWVNQAGNPVDPPMGQRQIADRTELTQGSAAALFAVALAVIGRQAHQRLNGQQLS
ncbi:MAG TPA: hypothetical protein VGS06_43340 [Streptosporangiaceae bacterium]|nr:hypothetical protein [Streptosporangiaceae bacterium]